MARIFISYKRADKDIVFPIVEEIRQKTGVDCWIDLEGIESGDQFQNVIIDAIDNADIVVFMLSKNFIAPDKDEQTGKIDLKRQTFPQLEVMYAINKRKRLIPLSIDGTTVFDCNWLTFRCSGIDCIDWAKQGEKIKFLRNISIWTYNKKICIVGELSSGKTSLALCIKKKFKEKNMIIRSSFDNVMNPFERDTHYSIGDIDLLGNHMTIFNRKHKLMIYDVTMMPNINIYSSFISEIDAVIYCKSICHFGLTDNDVLRINSIYKNETPFRFVYTKCDQMIDINRAKGYIEAYLTNKGIKMEHILYTSVNMDLPDNNRLLSFIEMLIESLV